MTERKASVKQVMDLSSISPELAYAAEDADLVVLEGMVSPYIGFPSCYIIHMWQCIVVDFEYLLNSCWWRGSSSISYKV